MIGQTQSTYTREGQLARHQNKVTLKRKCQREDEAIRHQRSLLKTGKMSNFNTKRSTLLCYQ